MTRTPDAGAAGDSAEYVWNAETALMTKAARVPITCLIALLVSLGREVIIADILWPYSCVASRIARVPTDMVKSRSGSARWGAVLDGMPSSVGLLESEKSAFTGCS